MNLLLCRSWNYTALKNKLYLYCVDNLIEECLRLSQVVCYSAHVLFLSHIKAPAHGPLTHDALLAHNVRVVYTINFLAHT